MGMIIMKNKLLTIFFLLVTSQVFAEECKSTDISKWHNCHGIDIAPNGWKYNGEFKNGKANGQGILTDPDGLKFIGEFKNDLSHGQLEISYANGEKYIGEYKNGKYVDK